MADFFFERLAALCLDEANKKPGPIARSKGNKLKQILSESGCKVKAAASLGFQQIGKLLANFPKGTKVVHRRLQAGYIRDDWSDQMTWAGHIAEGSHFEVLILGVPRDPEAFMEAATEAGCL